MQNSSLEWTRHTFLQSLISALNENHDVSNTKVQLAVTKEQYAAFRDQLRAIQPSTRNLHNHLRDGIKRYGQLLRKADSLFERAENSRHVRMVGLKYSRGQSLYQRAESAYEHVLEVLNDLVCMYPGVASFFDRPVIFKMGDEPTLDPISMPRLHTSRSPFALHMENSNQSPIYRLKLETLQASLTDLYGGAREISISRPAWENSDIDLLPPDAVPFNSELFDEDFL